MGHGGRRKGAGKPKGTTDFWRMRDKFSEEEVDEFVKHIKKEYKKDPKLALWLGNMLFQKPPQEVQMDANVAGDLNIKIVNYTE